MADDGLQWIEAALGAVSKITNDEDASTGLEDARCPKCDARDFAKIADLYSESVGRIGEQQPSPPPAEQGGMTDRAIAQRFVPPRQTSPIGIAAVVAAVLLTASYFIYRRFGETPGELAVMVAIVISAMVLMTMARSFSDRYYHRRQRWLKTWMCRRCGQLVSS